MDNNRLRSFFKRIAKAGVASFSIVGMLLIAILQPATAGTAKQDFEENCASCHGVKGDGHGTVPVLMPNFPMPNLTMLSRQNGGQFPFQEVVDVIDGRKQIPQHERIEMPFWGVTMQTPGAEFSPESDAAVKQRIDALARYIETLQEK